MLSFFGATFFLLVFMLPGSFSRSVFIESGFCVCVVSPQYVLLFVLFIEGCIFAAKVMSFLQPWLCIFAAIEVSFLSLELCIFAQVTSEVMSKVHKLTKHPFAG